MVRFDNVLKNSTIGWEKDMRAKRAPDQLERGRGRGRKLLGAYTVLVLTDVQEVQVLARMHSYLMKRTASFRALKSKPNIEWKFVNQILVT